MPLAKDYRPESLKDFVGSKNVVRALKSKITAKHRPHVFLFTGPSGCGKTTLARILAYHFKALLRDELPGQSMDYTELDAADFRGIDTIRSLRRQMNNKPMRQPCKLYLLDECHQLTRDAQEALLKALEETPKHIYFVLATTNPEKLKLTLKRRCAHFDLKPLTDKEMFEFLTYIVEEEDKDVPKRILKMLHQESLGSPGVALSLLETIIDLKPKQMMKQVKKAAREKNAAIDLCRSIIKKERWAEIASILRGLKNNSQNPESVRRAVLAYCASILLKEENGRAYLIMDAFRDPFYDTPWESLILACYEALYSN